MTDRPRLLALRRRLVAEQQRLLSATAEADIEPSSRDLARIADLEGAIRAVDAAIQESGST